MVAHVDRVLQVRYLDIDAELFARHLDDCSVELRGIVASSGVEHLHDLINLMATTSHFLNVAHLDDLLDDSDGRVASVPSSAEREGGIFLDHRRALANSLSHGVDGFSEPRDIYLERVCDLVRRSRCESATPKEGASCDDCQLHISTYGLRLPKIDIHILRYATHLACRVQAWGLHDSVQVCYIVSVASALCRGLDAMLKVTQFSSSSGVDRLRDPRRRSSSGCRADSSRCDLITTVLNVDRISPSIVLVICRLIVIVTSLRPLVDLISRYYESTSCTCGVTSVSVENDVERLLRAQGAGVPHFPKMRREERRTVFIGAILVDLTVGGLNDCCSSCSSCSSESSLDGEKCPSIHRRPHYDEEIQTKHERRRREIEEEEEGGGR